VADVVMVEEVVTVVAVEVAAAVASLLLMLLLLADPADGNRSSSLPEPKGTRSVRRVSLHSAPTERDFRKPQVMLHWCNGRTGV